MRRKIARQKALEERREIFAREYCWDYNGARAAREAGYSARRARQTAHELLRSPVVAAMIEERRNRLREETREEEWKRRQREREARLQSLNAG